MKYIKISIIQNINLRKISYAHTMKNIGTYKITRQGQITMPAEAREELQLTEGDMVDIYSGAGVVVIKKKRSPSEFFEELASSIRDDFKKRGITRNDVEKAIKEVRHANRSGH